MHSRRGGGGKARRMPADKRYEERTVSLCVVPSFLEENWSGSTSLSSVIGVESKHFLALASVLFEDPQQPGTFKDLPFEAGEGPRQAGAAFEPAPLSFVPLALLFREDFVTTLVKLRPEKAASVMDVADLRSEPAGLASLTC